MNLLESSDWKSVERHLRYPVRLRRWRPCLLGEVDEVHGGLGGDERRALLLYQLNLRRAELRDSTVNDLRAQANTQDKL